METINLTPMLPETKAQQYLSKYGRIITKHIITEILNSYRIDTREMTESDVVLFESDDVKYWNAVMVAVGGEAVKTDKKY